MADIPRCAHCSASGVPSAAEGADPEPHGQERHAAGDCDRLEGGGQPQACGWLTDRYGLRWQIVPRMLEDIMRTDDTSRGKRVAEAMLNMVKLDIATLKKAYES